MKQADSKSKQNSQQPISDVTIVESRYKEAIALADELLQKPGIDWEDLLEKENDERRNEQKQRTIKKKASKRDKDYYKNAEEYLRKSIQASSPKTSKDTDETRDLEACLRELQKLTPEGRKRGNQYLSALEQEQNRLK